ncbi:hypothetical protein AMK59_3462 [Oryctes borbonicus]|uniref:Zinc-finger domain-containing protein n=1 Tax=Oryctes borbonicus TaxID=1629725 RepID=A0A0T6B900_9SCAR|nr:hypothetical protein AMK59_3462 [Oryctes borbonicus]
MERVCSEEHEEGEIVDDFEDISDCSIPSTSYSGKSVSHRDLLQDVSLSSISENEPDALIYIDGYNTSRLKNAKRRRKSVHCRRRKKHKTNEYYSKHRFNRYELSSHSSNSSDVEFDPIMQKQLKEAIRIDRSEIHHNSLRTRLKAMLQSENVQSKTEDEDEETLRTLALLSNGKDDHVDIEEKAVHKNDIESADEKDEELIELRLAALKSAVLKKAPEIRKRKHKQQPKQVYEINKENNVNQENNVKDDNDNAKSIDMPDSKPLTVAANVKNDISRSLSVDEDIDIMRAKLLASMSKKIVRDLPKQNSVGMIPKQNNIKTIPTERHRFLKQQLKVKPLIINLNDSDSDTDAMLKKDQQNVNEKEIHLANSVSEFLKKQRAAVEAKTVVHSDKEIALDKSVVKLLPKSQQREYHLLKQKLLLAKRRRLRISCKIGSANGAVVKTTREVTAQSVCVKQIPDSKPTGLQKALDDIQIKKNGRLQMKGKYKALAPLLQKVNQASIERKQCELEIKMLLERLQKTRDKFAISHQNYTNLVMRLTTQKNAIDQRTTRVHSTKINNTAIVTKTTSTPVKCDIQDSVCDISSIQNNTHDNIKELDVNSNAAQTEHKDVILPQDDIDEQPKCDADNNALKQYVSPLDSKNRLVLLILPVSVSMYTQFIFSRDTVEDPLMSFCPYELFGVCKDSECKFNHCSKT